MIVDNEIKLYIIIFSKLIINHKFIKYLNKNIFVKFIRLLN